LSPAALLVASLLSGPVSAQTPSTSPPRLLAQADLHYPEEALSERLWRSDDHRHGGR
jgi:hypothetical protein